MVITLAILVIIVLAMLLAIKQAIVAHFELATTLVNIQAPNPFL